MPVSSAEAVAKRMQHVAESARKAQRVTVQRASMVMKQVHLAELDSDTSGRRLRNVGRNGARLGVGYKMQGSSANPSAIVEATGSAWPILNNPTKAHVIQPRKGRQAIAFNGVVRARAQHPGTRGKRTWQKAQPAAAKAGTAELNRYMTNVVQEAFKG